MKKILLICLILFAPKLFADDFMQYDFYPSTNCLGMYISGASRISDDTYSYFSNPSLSSFTATPNILSFRYGYTQHPLNSDNVSNNFAFAFNQRISKFGFGIGLFLQATDLGFRPIRDWSDDTVKIIGKQEMPSKYMKGINFSTYYGSDFKIGIGGNLKYINTENHDGIWAVDFGMFTSYQILENTKINDKISMDLLLSGGISKTNMIPKNDYEGAVDASNVRAGYSIQTGLNMKFNKNIINVLNISWTSEVGNADSKDDFLNTIKFWDDIILMNAQNSIGAYKITLLESISFMKGFAVNDDRPSNDQTSTFGLILSSKGIIKILNEYYEDKTIKWLNDNMIVDYSFAKVSGNMIPQGQSYYNHNIQISYKNLNLFGDNK